MMKIFTTPKVRKFARETGVNLEGLVGSERSGRISEQDVKEFIKKNFKKKSEISSPTEIKKVKNDYNHEEFGDIEIMDLPRVKKIAAPHLMESWTNIPHVTHHDQADVTELEKFRKNLKDPITGEKKKITPLAFIASALVKSLAKFPIFNSSILNINEGKLIRKKYFHIGFAVDTPHGLMVPKIRNVDKKSISDIGKELVEISEKCRSLKIDKKDFQGGSITITSLGGIGGSFFTPIINSPEAAILGIGKIISNAVYINNTLKEKLMLPLSLSYDHRIINGAEAARFCNEIKENLGKNFAYRLSV